MTAKKKTEPYRLTGDDACMYMHTALRKCCDSPITSALYHVVHMIDFKPVSLDPWRIFGELVASELIIGDGRKPLVQWVRGAANRVERVFYDRKREATSVPDGVEHALFALTCTLRCLSDDDWAGMVTYLKEEE